ncbi:hypothetical protein ACTQZS_08305 [Bilifractor sp. LCP19S3_H10]|uniref:hypothetical protein n=1 Tax=Bilifractor sp. LCP19S3_H10 TaxID=3438736 RepID=UPI003F93221B
MTGQKLKIVLSSLEKYTGYEDASDPYFLRMVNRNKKAMNGRYLPQTGRDSAVIEIFNLNRTGMEIAVSGIHNLAHHIIFCKYGSEKHSKSFYRCMFQLLSVAVRLGYIQYQKVSYLPEIKQMAMITGPVTDAYSCEKAVNADLVTLVVDNSKCKTGTRDMLRENGFTYSPVEQLWEKNAYADDGRELETRFKKIERIRVKSYPFTDLVHDPIITVKVEGKTYEYRDYLAKNGYRYSGIWNKKIRAKYYVTEKKTVESHRGLFLREMEADKSEH